MKIYEKIAEFNDTKGWAKKRIASECYMHKYCPADIEEDYNFIGKKRLNEFCQFKCDAECLDKYLELEVQHEIMYEL